MTNHTKYGHLPGCPDFPTHVSGAGIMKLRTPNLALFIVTVLLAIVGIWEYLGAPLSTPIPVVTLPMFAFSTSDIVGFLTAHAFWIMFAAWLFLAIGTVSPHGARARALSDHSGAQSRPAV
jgi:hypothetical protein